MQIARETKVCGDTQSSLGLRLIPFTHPPLPDAPDGVVERKTTAGAGGWLAGSSNEQQQLRAPFCSDVRSFNLPVIHPSTQAGIQPGKQPDSYNWMVQRSNSDTGEDSKVGLKIIRDYWLLPTVYPERHEQVGTLLMTSHFVFDPQGEG